MPKTKKRNDEIKEATASKIRNAGLKLFSTKGLAATSIIDIAAEAGISAGLLYHYYKSKEDLYGELVGMAISGANNVIREISAMPISPREKIQMLLNGICSQVSNDEHAALFYVFMPQVMLNDGLPDKIKSLLSEAFIPDDILRGIIVEGQRAGQVKDGDPEALSILFFSTITGLCTYKLMMGAKFVFPPIEILSGILLCN